METNQLQDGKKDQYSRDPEESRCGDDESQPGWMCGIWEHPSDKPPFRNVEKGDGPRLDFSVSWERGWCRFPVIKGRLENLWKLEASGPSGFYEKQSPEGIIK